MRSVARGRELSHAVIARTLARARVVARELGREPTLAIVAGTDPASRRFVQIKERLLADVALRIQPAWLSDGATTAEVASEVAALNVHNDVDAIFLQFPLPAQIDGQAAADALAPRKDIDCSGSTAEAEFRAGRTPFRPVAPQAAMSLLQDALGSVAGLKIVVCGAEDPFARALQTLLERGGARARVAPPDARDLRGILREADALVLGDVLPPAEAWSDVAWLPVILDASYYLPPRPHGWLPAGADERVGILLKQYGNIGPLTVAHLARATVRAAAALLRAERQS